MAESQSTKKQGGLSRGKAILIGVLGVALVGVLYLQFGRGGGESASPDRRGRGARRTPVVQTATAAEAKPETKVSTQPEQPAALVASVVDETKWKSPDLAEVVDYDPFALPESFPKPKAADPTGSTSEGLVAAAAADEAKKLADAIALLQAQLDELKSGGVQVIVRQGDQYVAMIGDRTLHVGEEIKGFTVTKIDPGGVVVERKEQ